MELFLSACLFFEDTDDSQFILLFLKDWNCRSPTLQCECEGVSVDWQSLITRPITSSILPSIILYLSPYLFGRFIYIAVGNRWSRWNLPWIFRDRLSFKLHLYRIYFRIDKGIVIIIVFWCRLRPLHFFCESLRDWQIWIIEMHPCCCSQIPSSYICSVQTN